MNIDILPLDNSGKINEDLLKKLSEKLSKRGIKTRILKTQKIPAETLNKARGQYDAFEILKKIDPNGVLAITEEDIFEGAFNFVYGLGNAEKSALVSYFRLRAEFYGEKANEKKLVERLTKECMHEIGHMLGMKHCTHAVGGKPCAMTFSTDIHEVDAKSDKFCKEHAKMLE
jgi:archaemetzincin